MSNVKTSVDKIVCSARWSRVQHPVDTQEGAGRVPCNIPLFEHQMKVCVGDTEPSAMMNAEWQYFWHINVGLYSKHSTNFFCACATKIAHAFPHI